MPAALEARGLSKAFHGFTAVDAVDLVIEEGETHAIIGPNGAGKTTLFNLLSGFLTPTSGQVLLFGENITHVAPHKIVRRGLSRSFQISSVFDTLTVEEKDRFTITAPTGPPASKAEPRPAAKTHG